MRTSTRLKDLHEAFQLNIVNKHMSGKKECTVDLYCQLTDLVNFVGGRSNWKLYPYILDMKSQALDYLLNNLDRGKGLDRNALFTYLVGKVEYSFREYISERIKGIKYKRAMKVIL